MFVVTLGLPASGSTWVFNVTRAILSTGDSATHCLYADDGLSVLDSLPSSAGHILLKAHATDQRLLRLSELANAKIIVSTRDHRDSLVSLTERFGISYQAASRDLTRSIVSLSMIPDGLSSLMLSYEEDCIGARETIVQIASFLEISLQEHTIDLIWQAHTVAAIRAAISQRFAEIPEELQAHDETTQWHPGHVGDGLVGKWRERLPPAVARAISAAVEPLSADKRGCPLNVKWEPELFCYDPAVSRSNLIYPDGVERVVVFGPYLHLPAGTWRAELRGESDVPLILDVFYPTSDRGTLCEIALPDGIRQRTRALQFEHHDHFAPLEIRLRTLEGQRGTINFAGVELSRA